MIHMKIEEADLLTSSELEQKVKEIYKMYDMKVITCESKSDETLLEELMDPNIPKSEREWYAARKITYLLEEPLVPGKWLNQRPTEPGWYWYMDDDYKRVVHVWRGGVSGVLFVEERSITPITDPRFDHILWWSQPLVPPN